MISNVFRFILPVVLLAILISSSEPTNTKAQDSTEKAKAVSEAIKAASELLKAQWAAFGAKQKLNALSPLKKAAESGPAVMSSTVVDERFRPAPEQRNLARSSTTPWYRPVDVVSVGNVLNVTLKVEKTSLTIGGDPVHLRCYNGVLAGPTLRAKPGDLLKIKLVNALPPNISMGSHNTLHEYNTTNLHTHGLHVSPSGNSDNVLLDVLPGTTKDFAIQIPANHPAGTFWYHAHRHGSVAAQVASGMSGAIVIEGGQDVVPAIAATKGARDRVMLLQQIPYVIPPGGTEGVIEEGVGQFGPGSWNSSARFTTINGVVLPVITLKPGEVERWRFVASGFRERIDLRLQRDSGGGPATLDFHEFAVDGIPLGKRDTKPGIELWPGYRSDVLIQAPAVEGVYLLIDEAADETLIGDQKNRKHLAKIVVAGAANPMALPNSADLTTYRPASIPAATVTGNQIADYGIDFTVSPLVFGINGKAFDDMAAPRLLTLGAVEDWTIRSVNPGIVHPFHIHVNAFEIYSIKNSAGVELLTAPIWRDTVAMKSNQTIRFRTRYEDFTGDFVQHCHILDHEDLGMMELVRIAPAGAPPPPPAVVKAVLPDPGKSPSVLFFVKGSYCPHCMSQVVEMDKLLSGRGVKVSVITATSAKDLEQFPRVSFDLVADPEQKLFKEHGAFGKEARHATIVRDGQGREVLRNVAEEPFTDGQAILAALKQAEPKFVIAVAGTDTEKDDYITWAPTPCTIRIATPMAGAADLTVTLTNDNPALIPTAGDVAFAETLATGKTATADTLTLTVKADGTPTNFFIAGRKASTLTDASLLKQGRDAVIETHVGNAAGALAGSQEVMVRVRKDLAKVNDLERYALQAAIAKLHTVPMGGTDFYLDMLRIHMLTRSVTAGVNHPNQAHRGSAFLTWHRAFLLRFEREMQKDDPTVSLHYWRMNQQAGPGLPSKVFDPFYWGSNDIGPGTVTVTFDSDNPLFDWKIGTSPLTRHRTNRGNISLFRPESSVLNYRKFRDLDEGEGFTDNLESNPHDVGHGWVGPWMGNCQNSPRDPIFWVFHCDLDRSWALWQGVEERFGTTGANPNDYQPNGAYTAGSSDAKGHHLKDTMWPWDGVIGEGAVGDPNDNRPPEAPGGPFPKSLLPGLWPPADAKPRSADVIDYLGVEDRAHNLGFCYDMVGYGKVTMTMVASAAAPKANFDTAPTWTERRRAVGTLNARNPQSKAKLLEIFKSAANDDTLRIDALNALVRGRAIEAFDASLTMLRDESASNELKSAAVRALGEMCMNTQVAGTRHHEAEQELKAVAVKAAVPVRQTALEVLVSMESPYARTLLLEQLQNKSPWLPAAEAITLLLASPRTAEVADAIRKHLESPDPQTQAMTVLGLDGDEPSRARRLALMVDADAPVRVRRAAVRSLMHSDPGYPEAALRLVQDDKADLELQRDAVAGLSVYARKNPGSKAKLPAWVDQLRKLESTPQKALRGTATKNIQSLEKLAR